MKGLREGKEGLMERGGIEGSGAVIIMQCIFLLYRIHSTAAYCSSKLKQKGALYSH
jgi:hypothetical protein